MKKLGMRIKFLCLMCENSLFFSHIIAESKLFLEITRVLIASKEYVPEAGSKDIKDVKTMLIFENLCRLFASITHLKENNENIAEVFKLYKILENPQ